MSVSVAAATRALKKFRFQNLPIKRLQATAENTQSKVEQSLIKAKNPFLPTQNAYNGHWEKPRYSLRMQKELVKKAKICGLVELLPPGPKLSLEEIKAAKRSGTVAPTSGKVQDWWLRPVEWNTEPVRTKPVPDVDAPTTPISTKDVSNVDDAARQAKLRLRRERAALRAKRKEMMKEARELGLVTMYVGRKRMFKGHKWERVRAERLEQQRLIMQSMPKRIRGFKTFYHRRRPSPLAVPRANNQNLPF
ncbi:hypothetical protein OE88DRAFT_1728918 [Heliocybe sulcata]|uniref:Large ribosomal subunit protein mL59 domain-containing protein n=1 Tax=Heliocybe sulcata TaxID=5364 RepID=A0A5C3MPI8_9AGAM|nr:hypothetical protein OE88DRAFT_1728918 [Heliocybe sulcata]